MNNTTTCPMCGGKTQQGITTFTVDYNQGVLVVRNVPAIVCSQCGEEWINDTISEKLEQFVAQAKSTKKQIEVIDFNISEAA